ncbi:MAG: alpha/beta hydrolase [Dehalococcoidia bacterium]|nr:alpha/beta hydrolase [Dehalococcoidia bacterium]
MPTIHANGIEQCYEFTGDGAQTIVWIHGIGSNHNTWNDVLPQIPGFRHLAYCVRGHGDSEKAAGPYNLELWAADCAALLDALGIEQAIVAGHSMGGAIAQRVAIDFPQKTKALFLLSTSSRVGVAAEAGWMKRADELEPTNPSLAASNRAVAKYNMDEEIKGVHVPTLIIVGDSDSTTPAGGSVIMSRCIEDAELEIYPGIGHMPLREEPKSVARLNAWLAGFQ